MEMDIFDQRAEAFRLMDLARKVWDCSLTSKWEGNTCYIIDDKNNVVAFLSLDKGVYPGSIIILGSKEPLQDFTIY